MPKFERLLLIITMVVKGLAVRLVVDGSRQLQSSLVFSDA